jgi:Tfp pilus assembly protein PilZ
VKHRRHRRIEAKGVEGHVRANTSTADGNIENLSAGGLFLRTSDPLPIGMPVLVEIGPMSGKEPLRVRGRVVSVVSEDEAERQDIPPGVGIEFDPLLPDTEKRLHALLRDLGLSDLAEPLETTNLFATASPDTGQVAANVRGLLEMLTDALHKVKERDAEIVHLKSEVRRLTGELDAARRRTR